MVNNTVVSLHSIPLPDFGAGAPRKIDGGPLYSFAQVLDVLMQGDDALQLWTKKCVQDVKREDLELRDVADYVELAMNTNNSYRGSEWCQQKYGGPWVAADVYRIYPKRWVEAAHKEMAFEFYLKFAIAKTGKLLLIVSCHPPEERN